MHPLLSVFALFLIVQNRPGSLEFIPETETFNKGRMMYVVMDRRVLHVLYILLNKKGFFFSEIVPQVRNPN